MTADEGVIIAFAGRRIKPQPKKKDHKYRLVPFAGKLEKPFPLTQQYALPAVPLAGEEHPVEQLQCFTQR